ncbi:amidohydrolase family protein [Streptomyces sp. MC1]|uniref:amidohydrolase family protein n=1 Tax=Streptomyces sp. MC1 TaxID=295105 RepID=UPI0018CB97DF|nr:amidohydrolase family protein [Streptomyces sp. MC1]MBG7704716.1 amidohydrolase family protein [Streptomyces sp. MC1]
MSAGVDAHVHLWDRSVHPQDWIDAETMAPIARDFDASDLSGMLASTGLDRAVVVQSSNSLEESIRLAGLDSPVVAGLVAWVDLAAEVGPQLDRIRMNAAVPVVGVRHLAHIDPDPQWMMREEVSAGLTVLEREGLCFDLVVREWQLPQAIHLATRHSGLRFVLDHLGGPPEPGQDRSGWASRLRELARRPNVVAKVSGLTSGLAPGSWCAADLAASVTVAVESFGPERLLYGSDWPLAELGGGAAPWKSAVEALLDGLSTVERARVFGGNAADVYSLS